MPIRGDKTEEETKLEEVGDINALQRYRFDTFWHDAVRTRERRCYGIKKLLKVERRLRETVQKEISLKKRYPERSRENSTDRSGSQTEEPKEKLDRLQCDYWMLERNWWEWRHAFPDGPLARAFELWRSHPRWYMHHVLVTDCIAKGGCCGRACGCCLNRDIEPTRTRGAGHCTVECQCCSEARGFELSERDKELLHEMFKFSEDFPNMPYFQQISLASIFGLAAGSYDDPFAGLPGDEQDQVLEGYVLVEDRRETA